MSSQLEVQAVQEVDIIKREQSHRESKNKYSGGNRDANDK